MSPADLKRLVRVGEGYHLEFKRRVSSPARIAREAVALTNTFGGTILVGVDDDGSVLGVKDSEEELFDLRRAFANYCRPAIPFRYELVPISRKRDVILITVPQSATKPHRLVDPDRLASDEVLVRVKDQTVTASVEMIELLRHENSEEGVQFEFGDKELLLLRYLETYPSINVDEFTRIAGLARDVASETLVVLTRAGVVRLVPGDRQDVFVLVNQDGRAAAG